MVQNGNEERAPMEDGPHGKICAKFPSLVHELDYANLLLHLAPAPAPKKPQPKKVLKKPAMHKKPAGKAPEKSDNDDDQDDRVSESPDDEEQDSPMESDAEGEPSDVGHDVVEKVGETEEAAGVGEKAKKHGKPLDSYELDEDTPIMSHLHIP